MQQLPSAVGLERLSVVAVCGLLLALAVFACIVPALRVARVNPAAALRHD
jgi:ABC-type lipoprotein release transport system permease subunit